MNLEGQHPVVPSLENLDERLELQQFKAILDNGRGRMPSFTHLDEKDRQLLMAFLYDKEKRVAVEESVIEIEPGGQVKYISGNGYNFFKTPDGHPAINPPWGSLTAYDLNEGEISWQIPLGEDEVLKARGVPATGTFNWGGPIVTAGGLLFIGATQNSKFRAFDKLTGELLWETSLPTGGFASPSTYEVDGKQYIVIACGGSRGTPSGDAYVAFSLP